MALLGLHTAHASVVLGLDHLQPGLDLADRLRTGGGRHWSLRRTLLGFLSVGCLVLDPLRNFPLGLAIRLLFRLILHRLGLWLDYRVLLT